MRSQGTVTLTPFSHPDSYFVKAKGFYKARQLDEVSCR
jgi:hypothetical protein